MKLVYSKRNQRYVWVKEPVLSISDKYKLIMIIFTAISMILLVATSTNAQSIILSNDRIMVELEDEEKAVKASSGCIKSKEDNRWETNLNKISIAWEVKFIKDSKLYLLYRDHQKYYESTTISGIRSKYASDLLGRDIKIQ